VADFQNFDEVMARLINDWQELGLPEEGPEKTCLAVAAPPHLETISFTNSPWRFDRALLKRYLTNSSIEIINDFAAVAHALPALSSKMWSRLVLGLLRRDNRWCPLARAQERALPQ
jgi:glucokinase